MTKRARVIVEMDSILYLLFLNEILIFPELTIPPTFLPNHFFVAVIH